MASSFVAFSSSLITSFVFMFTVMVSSSSSSYTSPSSAPSRPFKKIYAFGDSYTDTGNTDSSSSPKAFTYVSKLPYGTTFFHRPTNRYSDGRLMIDFVAESMLLPYLPPYLNRKMDTSRGVNFAVAGATAISHDFFVKNNISFDITPQSLQTQLLWFDEFLEGQGCRGGGPAMTRLRCAAVFEDALIWVGEIGANDYAYSIGSGVSDRTIQELAIKSITGFLQALLAKGAKYIVVQGLPATGCLPLAMTLAGDNDRDAIGCVATANKQSYGQNAVIQTRLHDLRSQYPHAVIAYADFWNAYRTVMKNASNYGFMERFKACCGSGGGAYNFAVFATCGSPSSTACRNPSQYINWDGVHLTEAMYKVIADSVLHGSYCHPQFKYLLSRRNGHLLGSAD